MRPKAVNASDLFIGVPGGKTRSGAFTLFETARGDYDRGEQKSTCVAIRVCGDSKFVHLRFCVAKEAGSFVPLRRMLRSGDCVGALRLCLRRTAFANFGTPKKHK